MFGAIAGGIASALAGGAMSKLFGGGQKAASGGIQGDVLATDNNTVGMGDAGIKSAIQGSNVPNLFKLAPSVCRMTFPILASLLVRLVVLLPFQLLRLSLATPSRWTPLALSVFLHCVVALLLTLL